MRRVNSAVVLGMFETGLGIGRSLGRNGIKVWGLDHKKDIGFYSKYIRALSCPHPFKDEIKFIKFLTNFSKKHSSKFYKEVCQILMFPI